MITFVTGTDTDVGKTIVTAALVVRLRSQGRSVYVVKPAQTGVGDGSEGDLDVIRGLVGAVDGEEGVRLAEALAPDVAARREGVTLPSVVEQTDRIVAAASDFDDVLVEGAGGITVRVGTDFGLLDLADAVRDAGQYVDFVVVARAGLGTLNHSVLTVDAIHARRHEVRGLIIGSWPAEPGLAERTNLDELPPACGVPVIGAIPEGSGALDADSFAKVALNALSL